MFHSLDGGCLCGATQYRISLELLDAGYCHCRLCQRSSGAPTIAWLTVSVDGFTYSNGEPMVFQSSPDNQREFCGVCGTQLAFRKSVSPKTVDVTLASLYEPSRVTPQYHVWRQSKIADRKSVV